MDRLKQLRDHSVGNVGLAPTLVILANNDFIDTALRKTRKESPRFGAMWKVKMPLRGTSSSTRQLTRGGNTTSMGVVDGDHQDTGPVAYEFSNDCREAT